ncbi:MAG: hypothetical protein K1Y36_18685 [Blastocatellia bacterium]|nr:hypothetical protein [Blastocatellia bacterium]
MLRLQAIVIGILLGFLLVPPQPAQAQLGFGGLVHDPRAYALQLEKKIQEAQRWVETVKYWTDLGQKMASAVTSLDGILGLAEEQLARDNKTRLTISQFGKTVRAAFQLKRQLEGLVQARVAGLRNIQSRFRQGICNPAADLRDLENYLTTKMGKICDRVQADYERMAAADLQLQRWIEELQRIERQLPGIYQEMYAAERALNKELEKPEASQSKETIQRQQEIMQSAEARIDELEKRHNDLLGLAEERCEKYQVVLNYRAGMPSDTVRFKQASDQFLDAKLEFLKAKLAAY